jgi:Xaa-Pro aminopeptidase
MRRLFGAFLLLLLSAPASPIPIPEYAARRAALRKDLQGSIVLFGRNEGSDDPYAFIQEPNFYYLTGWTEPGAILLITPTQDTLFLPHHNKRREAFTGSRPSAEDQNVQSVTGFDHVLPVEKFEAALDQALDSYEPVYALPNQPDTARLKDRYPFRAFADPAPMIAKLRVKKSPAEIAAIQHSTDVTVQGHLAAWKRMSSGLREYQIAATVTNVYLENGCERHAYDPIVGSGPNSTILHYGVNKRRMDSGEIVVMDTAAECDEYASDVTRTIPVSGKFSARQREIYNVVLGAQLAAIAAVKPGARMGGDENSITKIVKDYMDAHGKDLHGQPLSKYFIHGLGHPVGLQVHDAGVPGPLEAGMVITIEPGIYIPEENIGVRIEDVVLVTETGFRVLSAALPKEPDQIEKAMAH